MGYSNYLQPIGRGFAFPVRLRLKLMRYLYFLHHALWRGAIYQLFALLESTGNERAGGWYPQQKAPYLFLLLGKEWCLVENSSMLSMPTPEDKIFQFEG